MAGFGASVTGCEVEERNFGDGGSGGAGASSPDSGGSCTVPSDCPAPADPCQISACVDGRCGAALLPEGTEIEPVAGDCQRTVCDGRGARKGVPADELPDDGNPCTVDACAGVTPEHSPQPGSSCPGGICDEAGQCVPAGCSCPGGDCDEAGECAPAECVDDADCDTSTECAEHICIDGACLTEPIQRGMPCGWGGQEQCDGEGQCMGDECVEDSDCPCGFSETCICLTGSCYPVED
ncbi:hypothetical protein WME75_27425 [Sorangium sp. So ce1014]|uniref:hypothetical protein n=1 Tax=Sorangium sp. So ce1014 TaxID=3133326 RepID=UPI003F608E6E